MQNEPSRDEKGRFLATVPLVDGTSMDCQRIGRAEVYQGDGSDIYYVDATVTDEMFIRALAPKMGGFSIAPDTFRK